MIDIRRGANLLKAVMSEENKRTFYFGAIGPFRRRETTLGFCQCGRYDDRFPVGRLALRDYRGQA